MDCRAATTAGSPSDEILFHNAIRFKFYAANIQKTTRTPKKKKKKYLQNYGTIAIFATENLKTIKNEEDYIITNRY